MRSLSSFASAPRSSSSRSSRSSRAASLLLSSLAGLAGLAGCGDDRAAEPTGDTIRATVMVPEAYRTAPFDEPQVLDIPAGYEIGVIARIPGARFMALTPDGDLLVSRPGTFGSGDPSRDGKIFRVRTTGSGVNASSVVTEFSSGLRMPHDLVFTEIDGTTYLYISESHQVVRAVYQDGDATLRPTEVIVPNLPDNFSGELQGRYGHSLKNIAIGGGKLYTSVASTSNADPSDVTAQPPRAAIFVSELDGQGKRVFAEGLRNAEGLDFAPDGELWAVVNHRDNVAFPPGHANEGQIDQLYVNNHPAEPFTRVRDGANYGWPYCNPNPDSPSGMTDLPFERDWQNNADGRVDCAQMERISKGIQAHSAPLGVTFLHDSSFSAKYKNGAVTALHGCWNCSVLVGYKVSYFPWENGTAGEERDFISGWRAHPVTNFVWGRPVDAIPDADGNLIVSDDFTGTLYRLSPAKN
jgi:glucose/arabinose dehydrogenase